MRRVLTWLALALLAFAASIWVASEQGGEVVELRTTGAAGEVHTTRLWIVEIGPDLWLRAGDPGSGWVQRLEAEPQVELVRRGRAGRFRATVVPHMGPEVDRKMAEEYGLADRLIAVFRTGQSIGIRLDPDAGRGPPSGGET